MLLSGLFGSGFFRLMGRHIPYSGLLETVRYYSNSFFKRCIHCRSLATTLLYLVASVGYEPTPRRTSAKIVQTGEEEVEEFAARIRSIVNRAGYTTEADKSEACLNAFLNGLNAELADKLYAAPDVENSFEVAVSTARKLEKMRKVRASPATPEPDILSSVLRVSESRGSRDQQQNRSHTERSQEQQDLLSQASNYGRQGQRSGYQPRHNNSSQRGASERRVRPETRTCYRCGVKGHIARSCRASEPLNL